MTPIILESPYDGDIERNLAYARRCARNAICEFSEAPFISHLMYPQPGLLDDHIWSERTTGLLAAREWYRFAIRIVVYEDYGVSPGMQLGIDEGRRLMKPVLFRKIL